jgi:nucleoside-diphosphate-sugar epimerase
MYVGEVASALWFLMKHNLGGVFNVCSGFPVQLKSLMATLEEILGKKGLIDYGAIEFRDWEPMMILGDNRKLRQAGWEPEVTLREGLLRTVDWWKHQKDL